MNAIITKMIKKWKKNEDDEINDKKNDECNDNQNDKKKMKKIFWPGPVCGCKFFITLRDAP